ncbi:MULTISPECIES: hypothetical protein [Bacillus]|uniref:hypothetical protein n=1 Tax=Bacillus TaxID=1386 RepID=UPI0008FE3D79|nr:MULTISPECIES: hypothetical protein [Bacillus]OJE32427.1 hypothetical protein BAQ44_22335 [Bacillus mobilis]HDR7244806.1 hypothetical protein [Bacillus mobilis]
MRTKKQDCVLLVENKVAKAQLWGYPNEEKGIIEDIELYIGEWMYKPSWIHLNHPAFPPEIHFVDLNNDGIEEVIVLLHKGSGSGVSIWEIHILEEGQCGYSHVFVENPEDHVHINMESMIKPYIGEINYFSKKQTETWKVPFSQEIQKDRLFDKFVIGSQIRFKVEENDLVAFVGLQLAFLYHVAELQLQYEYKNGKYLIKKAKLHTWD